MFLSEFWSFIFIIFYFFELDQYNISQIIIQSTTKSSKKVASQVLKNKDEIRKIQGTYIKSIEDENRALGLLDESEEIGEWVI